MPDYLFEIDDQGPASTPQGLDMLIAWANGDSNLPSERDELTYTSNRMPLTIGEDMRGTMPLPTELAVMYANGNFDLNDTIRRFRRPWRNRQRQGQEHAKLNATPGSDGVPSLEDEAETQDLNTHLQDTPGLDGTNQAWNEWLGELGEISEPSDSIEQVDGCGPFSPPESYISTHLNARPSECIEVADQVEGNLSSKCSPPPDRGCHDTPLNPGLSPHLRTSGQFQAEEEVIVHSIFDKNSFEAHTPSLGCQSGMVRTNPNSAIILNLGWIPGPGRPIDPIEIEMVHAGWNMLYDNADIVEWVSCLLMDGKNESCILDRLFGLSNRLFDRFNPQRIHFQQMPGGGFAAMWVWHVGKVWDQTRDLAININTRVGSQWDILVNDYANAGDNDERSCAIAAVAATLFHELMHVCQLNERPDELYTCHKTYLLGTSFVWAMGQRYPCLTNADRCAHYIWDCMWMNDGNGLRVPPPGCYPPDEDEPESWDPEFVIGSPDSTVRPDVVIGGGPGDNLPDNPSFPL